MLALVWRSAVRSPGGVNGRQEFRRRSRLAARDGILPAQRQCLQTLQHVDVSLSQGGDDPCCGACPTLGLSSCCLHWRVADHLPRTCPNARRLHGPILCPPPAASPEPAVERVTRLQAPGLAYRFRRMKRKISSSHPIGSRTNVHRCRPWSPKAVSPA